MFSQQKQKQINTNTIHSYYLTENTDRLNYTDQSVAGL
jgi:hypothetical protein